MRCVIVGCDRKANTRGLCRSCYHTALRLVQAGEADWCSLEKSGLCGPLMRTPNAFAAAYAKLPALAKDLPGQMNLLDSVDAAYDGKEDGNEMSNT